MCSASWARLPSLFSAHSFTHGRSRYQLPSVKTPIQSASSTAYATRPVTLSRLPYITATIEVKSPSASRPQNKNDTPSADRCRMIATYCSSTPNARKTAASTAMRMSGASMPLPIPALTAQTSPTSMPPNKHATGAPSATARPTLH